MRELLFPWAQQPTEFSRVDATNPLTDRLIGLSDSRYGDLISGQGMEYSGSVTLGPDQGGQGSILAAPPGYALAPANGRYTGDHAVFAYLSAGRLLSSTEVVTFRLATDSTTQTTSAIRFGTNGARVILDNNQGAEALGTYPGPTLVLCQRIGTTAYLYVEGELRAQWATGNRTGTLTGMIAGRLSGNNVAPYAVYLMGMYARGLSLIEIQSLSVNPWQLLEPQRIPVPASVGSADFLALTAASIALADSAGAAVAGNYARSIIEAIAAAAAQGAQVARTSARSESAPLADTVAVSVARAAAVAEPASLSGTQGATAAGEYVGAVTELAALASAQSASAAAIAAIAEAVMAGTSQTSTAAQAAAVAEAMVLAEQINASTTGDYVGAVLESINAAQTAAAVTALVVGLLERLEAGDQVAAMALAPGAYLVAIQEPASLADAASALRGPPQDAVVPVSRTRRVVLVAPGRIVQLQIPNRRVTL